MLPTAVTVDAIFGGAQSVVTTYFGGLILLALILVAGIWAVKFVPGLLSRMLHKG